MKTAVALLMAVASVASFACGERPIRIEDLPAAVRDAVQREERAGASVKGVTAERENGQTVYEVETMMNGRTRDFIVDTNGTIVEAEEEMSVDVLPAPVKAALEANGKILKVESQTKAGRVTYEAQMEKSGRKTEVVVDAAGAPVKN